MLCLRSKSTSWCWNFLPSVLLPSALRAAFGWLVWHVCHSHSFTLKCFGVWHFIPVEGWAAATLFFHYSRFTATLFSLTTDWCDFQTVLCSLNFWKVKSTVQYMCNCTVHAVVKFRAVLQHPCWRTYSTCTAITWRPVTIYANNYNACTCKIHVKYTFNSNWS